MAFRMESHRYFVVWTYTVQPERDAKNYELLRMYKDQPETEMKRPQQIIFRAFDPFDDTELTTATLNYEPRRAATGFYTRFLSRHAEAAQSGCPQILEGRQPVVTVETV